MHRPPSAPTAAFPIKVISNMPNPGNGDAIRLTGCRGDGKRRTVDLILDVNGNGRDRGTGFDAVGIGMDARDLVVTGDVECGARHTDPNIHQDIVQALSGRNIVFRNFTSGNPGRWTCWGAGAVAGTSRGNGGIPRNLICSRCRLATYNQNLRIDRSIHSGSQAIRLRLQPLVRHLHRPGSPTAHVNSGTASSSTEGPGRGARGGQRKRRAPRPT